MHQIEEVNKNLLDKTVVSIYDEELDSLEKLNISNVDGKDFEDIEGCKDAIRFTSSCPIGKWFSDLGSNITVYRSSFTSDEIECITNIIVAAYENDDFYENSIKDNLET